MRSCPVCTSCRRVEIETALFRVHSDDGPEALENISKAFDIEVPALQEHMLFHAAMSSADSIARQIKMREADLLTASAIDQFNTMKSVGKRLRDAINEADSEDVRFEKCATKSVVDLYIGSADGLRRTVQTIADVNQLLNGPKDDGLSGLGALAKALDMSRQMVATPQEPAPLGQFNNLEGVNEP